MEKIANFCTKDIPNLKIWPTFPGRRCESNTQWLPHWAALAAPLHRRQGGIESRSVYHYLSKSPTDYISNSTFDTTVTNVGFIDFVSLESASLMNSPAWGSLPHRPKMWIPESHTSGCRMGSFGGTLSQASRERPHRTYISVWGGVLMENRNLPNLRHCDKRLILCHWNLHLPWIHQLEGPWLSITGRWCQVATLGGCAIGRYCRETLPGEKTEDSPVRIVYDMWWLWV